jgi:RNA 2',3'-cyclic 3'-phosphodiesterase
VEASSSVGSDGSPDPGDRTLRLFVALELPESVRTTIGAWGASELASIGSLRPVRIDGLHVTLCFLGATADSEVEAIGACCRRAATGLGPLRLSIGGLLALPRRRPRAVTVRVSDEGHGALGGLQSGFAGALTAGGWYRPESRPFLAHVTVARIRSGTRLDARVLAERAETGVASLSKRLPTAFTADVVTLFESQTQPGGAVYQPRARIELAA